MAAASFAQTGSVAADIAERLVASTAAERAWGAYQAADRRAQGHDAALVALLEDPGPFEPMEKTAIRRSVLDAIVRCGVAVPPELLLAQTRQFPAQTLTIAARDPVTHDEAIRAHFHDGAHDNEWLVAGGLLMKRRAPGFAARLLRRLVLRVDLYVVDDDTWHGGGGRAGIRTGCGSIRVPKGFPPIVRWKLIRGINRSGKGITLTSGRHPMDASRSVHHRTTIGCGSNSRLRKRHQVRLDWLYDLLGEDAAGLDIKPRRSFRIEWGGSAAYKAAARLHLASVNAPIDTMIARLREKRLLTDAEAQLARPLVDVRVNDKRNDKSVALPSY